MVEVIKELNENLKSNIDGYIAMSIVDVNSGETLFSESLNSAFDIDLASACNLEVVKAKLKAIDTLELDDHIDNIFIHLQNEIHIIDVTDSKDYFIYLSLDSNKSSIGLVKSLLKKYSKKLNDEI